MEPYRTLRFGQAHASRNELFNIHVARCLTPDECDWVIEQSNAHGSWTTEVCQPAARPRGALVPC